MTDTTSPVLVGRDSQLGRLAALAAAAGSGQPQVAIVHGAAGLGKSQLVEAFLHRCRPARILRASGASWEADLAGGVLEQLLRRGTGAATAGQPSGAGSFGVLPEDPREAGLLLLERLQMLASKDAASESAGQSVSAAADRASVEEPCMMWIDDLHWADEYSLRALACALRRLDSERLLVLLAVPDEQWQLLPAGFRELAGSAEVARIGLAPLSADDVGALAWEAASTELSAPMALRLCNHAAGNPGHILQLLEEQPDGYWADWHAELPVPKRLLSGMTASLAAAAPATRSLAEAASVLQPGCRLADAVALADAGPVAGVTDPLAALDEANRLGLLVANPDPTLLAFPHPLARAAVYASMPATERAALHRLAASLEADEGQQLHHLASATALPDVGLAHKLEDYARRQAERGAWRSAASALMRASRLWPDPAGSQERLLHALDALVGAGDLAQAGAFARQADNFAPGPLRAAVLGYLSVLRGRPIHADMKLDKAWEQCDPEADPQMAAMICQRRVLHSLAAQNGQDLVDWARRAMTLAAECSPEFIESRAIKGLGLAMLGQREDAEDLYSKFPSPRALGAQRQRVQLGRGWLALAQDDHHLARDQLAEAVPTEYHLGSGRISQWAHGWLARAEFELGDWDQALRTVERGLVQQEQLQVQLARPLLHWTAAQIHAQRGNWDRSAHHQESARVPADSYAIMRLPAALASAAAAEAAADYDGVLRALAPVVRMDRANGIDEPGFWPWHDIYANALVMTEHVDEASHFLAPHEKLAALRGHRTAAARLSFVRGRILGARGRIEEARKAFEGGIAAVQTLPVPHVKARSRFAYGQTLRRAGRRREAAAILAEARDIYLSLGATVYVERCEREIQASGVASGTRRSGLDFEALTAQEIAVARLVAQGRTNKETGLELFIAAKTVQYHLTRIYAKLGISSRSELAARYRADEAG
ncbi:LuxR family transcriptional regulator [Arthrobacter crystallopoietes BAB-32]|uniref:LuxR family transcriptional regulator n=1 Tax=Arthrobacter crystallopoietes BAB-32 TaxID=1246476 RepID=N1UPT9_9MICC|nr:LuxR family transcriptional regulator [Arthrobacter crystallopoietes]EMY32406.1 LuxR family transcriptional regulator [Arthrobacter crystallopoietes BAB-32]